VVIKNVGLIVVPRFHGGIPRYRILLPFSLRGILISQFHDPKVSGHLGIAKTLAKQRDRFIWPAMKEGVTRFINNCISCKPSRAKPSNQSVHRKKSSPLQPIFPFSKLDDLQPGEFISTDLLGPFPESLAGNKMIIVVTDLLTRYVFASPIRDNTAEVVADFLLNIVICVYGAFRIMLSENGKCYQSKLMQEISKAIGANQRFTNPYTPECNGLTERFNKTICEMMSHHIPQSKFVEWDKNIPALVFAHNTSFHPSIRQGPHFLMFNRVARLPIDVSLRLSTAFLIADPILSRKKT
jgi:transposase InsO family protein